MKDFISWWTSALKSNPSAREDYELQLAQMISDKNMNPVARILLVGSKIKNNQLLYIEIEKKNITAAYVLELTSLTAGAGDKKKLESIELRARNLVQQELASFGIKFEEQSPKKAQPLTNKNYGNTSFIKPVKRDKE